MGLVQNLKLQTKLRKKWFVFGGSSDTHMLNNYILAGTTPGSWRWCWLRPCRGRCRSLRRTWRRPRGRYHARTAPCPLGTCPARTAPSTPSESSALTSSTPSFFRNQILLCLNIIILYYLPIILVHIYPHFNSYSTKYLRLQYSTYSRYPELSNNVQTRKL